MGSSCSGFSSCSTRALLSHSIWDLPEPGTEPVLPGLDDISDSMDMSLSKLWETVKDRKPGVLHPLRFSKGQMQLSDSKTPYIDKRILNHWTTREAPRALVLQHCTT